LSITIAKIASEQKLLMKDYIILGDVFHFPDILSLLNSGTLLQTSCDEVCASKAIMRINFVPRLRVSTIALSMLCGRSMIK